MSDYHIHIGHHFFGAGNVGDDLMMAGFLLAAKRYMPGVRLTCCTPHDRSSQALRFPEVDWLPYDRATREQCVRSCDVWLGLGDSPFHAEIGSWFLDHLIQEMQICQRFSKPMFFLGVGVNDALALKRPQTRALAEYADHIWTRDQESAAGLAALCGWEKVTAGADLAHIYLRGYSFEAESDNVIAFVLNFEDQSAFSKEALCQLIAQAGEGRYLWLVQEVRQLPGSELSIYHQLSPSCQARLELCVPDYKGASTSGLLAAWGAPPSVIVTSRYHGAVTGAWMGSRVVAVTRNFKVQGAVSQLGLPNIPAFTSLPSIMEGIRVSHAVPRSTLDALADLADACCSSFFQLCRSGVQIGHEPTISFKARVGICWDRLLYRGRLGRWLRRLMRSLGSRVVGGGRVL